MPTGSGLWHFLYRSVRKFIRSVVSGDKEVATTSRNWKRKTFIMIRLHRILPPKMPFFVRQKVQILSKILQRIPNFASFSPSENGALSAEYNCC